jgi:hypothetical protein
VLAGEFRTVVFFGKMYVGFKCGVGVPVIVLPTAASAFSAKAKPKTVGRYLAANALETDLETKLGLGGSILRHTPLRLATSQKLPTRLCCC